MYLVEAAERRADPPEIIPARLMKTRITVLDKANQQVSPLRTPEAEAVIDEETRLHRQAIMRQPVNNFGISVAASLLGSHLQAPAPR
jgi:hypothetical protein